jgi:pyridoxine 5-phosphate synthase
VPERREEVTTEGGLNVGDRKKIADNLRRLQDAGIRVSLFLDPDPAAIDAAVAMKADAVELHTGQYALATDAAGQAAELARLVDASARIVAAGLALHAGHGLTYRNVRPIAAIAHMHELNIGHSIVARALMVGFEQAVREMKKLIS